ncbi:nucleotidyltransferase family protein [Geodermatophilus maliterrae]|uniref:Nucleotidyltransferase family protein n=1 Tax=Geodermatophilus maliterrae TaxID=3162531 RepID=A0ABV3XHM8_9ACTN
MRPDEETFLDVVLADPTVAEVLRRAPALGVHDWWLTAGVLFQTVWNARTGRPPGTGILDADLFYFDPDTGWDAEDAVIARAVPLFAGLPVPVEVRNEARVHLWYAGRFGVPAPAAFRDCSEAIDSFAAVCCAVGVTVDSAGRPRVYAPYGMGDLFDLVVRPNRRSPAPRHVYEAKAARWQSVWPELTVLSWDPGTAGPALRAR